MPTRTGRKARILILLAGVILGYVATFPIASLVMRQAEAQSSFYYTGPTGYGLYKLNQR